MSGKQLFASLLFGFVGLTPTSALAQFFLDLSGVTVVGPVVCTTTDVSSPLSGTISYDLPANSPNIIIFTTVNGVPAATQTTFITPPVDTITATSVTFGFSPPATLPYTLVATVFPLVNGQPVGSGFQGSATCPAGGGGTLIISPASLGGHVAVPAMTPPWLLALALLIALAGLVSVARRRSGPG